MTNKWAVYVTDSKPGYWSERRPKTQMCTTFAQARKVFRKWVAESDKAGGVYDVAIYDIERGRYAVRS